VEQQRFVRNIVLTIEIIWLTMERVSTIMAIVNQIRNEG
jgi:hypothetical protein